jgi:hypothetical protein
MGMECELGTADGGPDERDHHLVEVVLMNAGSGQAFHKVQVVNHARNSDGIAGNLSFKKRAAMIVSIFCSASGICIFFVQAGSSHETGLLTH